MGMNQRQIESMILSSLSSMRMELNREYANVLYRQGRAKGDCADLNSAEQDTVAMIEAYSTLLARSIATVIDTNNRRLMEEIKKQINGSDSKTDW